MSRPARARGSKLRQSARPVPGRRVASRAGARIETRWRRLMAVWIRRRVPRGRADRNKALPAQAQDFLLVASRAGARIETIPSPTNPPRSAVASRAGARIETPGECRHGSYRPRRVPRGRADRNKALPAQAQDFLLSRPARARGSKLDQRYRSVELLLSRPARARGSKPDRGAVRPRGPEVASRAGARIETPRTLRSTSPLAVSRPARARGSKHGHPVKGDGWRQSRPARARGSKLPEPRSVAGHNESRPARARGSKHGEGEVADSGTTSRPARARGSKLGAYRARRALLLSRPARARGSKRV